MAVRQNASTGQLVDDASASQETSKATSHLLHVKVWSPFRVYFDEIGRSISAVNGTGPFDILPGHHNFITLLSSGELVIEALDRQQRILISGGIMHVKNNYVTVFLEV